MDQQPSPTPLIIVTGFATKYWLDILFDRLFGLTFSSDIEAYQTNIGTDTINILYINLEKNFNENLEKYKEICRENNILSVICLEECTPRTYVIGNINKLKLLFDQAEDLLNKINFFLVGPSQSLKEDFTSYLNKFKNTHNIPNLCKKILVLRDDQDDIKAYFEELGLQSNHIDLSGIETPTTTNIPINHHQEEVNRKSELIKIGGVILVGILLYWLKRDDITPDYNLTQEFKEISKFYGSYSRVGQSGLTIKERNIFMDFEKEQAESTQLNAFQIIHLLPALNDWLGVRSTRFNLADTEFGKQVVGPIHFLARNLSESKNFAQFCEHNGNNITDILDNVMPSMFSSDEIRSIIGDKFQYNTNYYFTFKLSVVLTEILDSICKAQNNSLKKINHLIEMNEKYNHLLGDLETWSRERFRQDTSKNGLENIVAEIIKNKSKIVEQAAEEIADHLNTDYDYWKWIVDPTSIEDTLIQRLKLNQTYSSCGSKYYSNIERQDWLVGYFEKSDQEAIQSRITEVAEKEFDDFVNSLELNESSESICFMVVHNLNHDFKEEDNSGFYFRFKLQLNQRKNTIFKLVRIGFDPKYFTNLL